MVRVLQRDRDLTVPRVTPLGFEKHCSDRPKLGHALTFNLDRPIGADQWVRAT